MANSFEKTGTDQEQLESFISTLLEIFVKYIDIEKIPEELKNYVPHIVNFACSCYAAIKSGNITDTAKANKLVGLGICSNVISLAVEIIRLKEFWDFIKKAENLVESSQATRREIDELFSEIESLIKELEEFVETVKTFSFSANRKIDNLKDKVTNKFIDLKLKIYGLKINIEGQIFQFKNLRKQNLVHGIAGCASGSINLTSVAILADTASPIMGTLGLVLALTNWGISMYSLASHLMTEDTMKSLQNELNEIEKLEENREKCNDKFSKLMDQIYSKMDDLVKLTSGN